MCNTLFRRCKTLKWWLALTSWSMKTERFAFFKHGNNKSKVINATCAILKNLTRYELGNPRFLWLNLGLELGWFIELYSFEFTLSDT